MACDAVGRPLAFVTTGGNTNDCTQFTAVIVAMLVPRTGPGRPRLRPDHLIADKGYSSKVIRAWLRRRGIVNPTDRGKLRSKIHLICDRSGLPLFLGISGANMHDSLGLEPLVRGIPPIRSRRGPRRRRPAKLHADKGYDYDHLRRWLGERGIRPRIARKGIESSQRLGRHWWVVERTVSWLAGCRRFHRRYERKAEHFLAFVGVAAALIGYRRLRAVP